MLVVKIKKDIAQRPCKVNHPHRCIDDIVTMLPHGGLPWYDSFDSYVRLRPYMAMPRHARDETLETHAESPINSKPALSSITFL